MKKFILVVLCVMILCLFSGCAIGDNTTNEPIETYNVLEYDMLSICFVNNESGYYPSSKYVDPINNYSSFMLYVYRDYVKLDFVDKTSGNHCIRYYSNCYFLLSDEA